MVQDNFTFEDLDKAYNLGDAESEEDKVGLICEIKTFEGRYNSSGERVILDIGSR